jgi:hypothetical protein
MRKLLISTLVFSVLFSLLCLNCTKKNETGPDPQSGYKRNVIAEMFTYHDCPNCPVAEKALDSLFAIHGDSLIIIEYHVRILGDTLSPCSAFVSQREALYNIGGYPTVEFDGIEENVGASGDLFSIFTNIMESRYADRSDLKFLLLQASFNNATSISYDIQLLSQADVTGKLFIVLLEDSVIHDGSVYDFVARQVFPGESGMDFSVLQDDTFSTSGSIPLMWHPTGTVWVVAFIQNISSKTIHQGKAKNIGKATAASYEYNLTIAPDTFLTVLPESIATFYLYLEHTGTVADEYELVASEVDTVAGWSWFMCSGGLCYPPVPTIIDTLSINPGVVDTFDIKIHTNTNTGTEKISVTFSSLGEPTEIESVNLSAEVQ